MLSPAERLGNSVTEKELQSGVAIAHSFEVEVAQTASTCQILSIEESIAVHIGNSERPVQLDPFSRHDF